MTITNPYHDYPYTYRLLVSYEGTSYVGWQIQPNGLSIQGELKAAISKFLQEEVIVIGSGRTDSGVHALGQVAHFRCRQEVELQRFLRAVNGLLSPDIRVKEIQRAPSTFHALFSATGKVYHYHLCLDPFHDPFRRRYSLHVKRKVNLDRLRQGAQALVGTHDFSAFANEANKGAAAKNAVRTMRRVDIVEEEGGIRLEIEANGFLYKMVRNIVGTLLGGSYEGTKYPEYIDDIEGILASKNRKRAGRAAQAQGLFLVEVFYDKDALVIPKNELL